jgi:hypothetical protein
MEIRSSKALFFEHRKAGGLRTGPHKITKSYDPNATIPPAASNPWPLLIGSPRFETELPHSRHHGPKVRTRDSKMPKDIFEYELGR